MKQTTATRLIKLMEKMAWQGTPNWTIVDPVRTEKQIIPFRKWVRFNLQFLPTPEVRQAIEVFFLDGSSQDGSRFYQLKDFGVEALIALYNKETYQGEN